MTDLCRSMLSSMTHFPQVNAKTEDVRWSLTRDVVRLLERLEALEENLTLEQLDRLFDETVYGGDTPDMPLLPRLRRVLEQQQSLQNACEEMVHAVFRFVSLSSATALTQARSGWLVIYYGHVRYCDAIADLLQPSHHLLRRACGNGINHSLPLDHTPKLV